MWYNGINSFYLEVLLETTHMLVIDNMALVPIVFGSMDAHLKLIEKTLNITAIAREGKLIVLGEARDVDVALSVFKTLLALASNQDHLDEQAVRYTIDLARAELKHFDAAQDALWVTPRGRYIKAKTHGQSAFIDAIKKHDVVFGIGPAGTGKTFLAVTMAIKAFKEKKVERIVITRPAVEAGESLGFLPGDLQQKIDPYLRPLYDAMYETLGMESFLKYKERGMIEVVPLAYMRGRTLDNAYIILDEAQNTTPAQMKMFLTRFGFGSKVIVNGDLTQIDLGDDAKSGLVEAVKVLHNVEGVAFHYFTKQDVVRHALVKRIIQAYETMGKELQNGIDD